MALQLRAQTTGEFMDIHLLKVGAPSEWGPWQLLEHEGCIFLTIRFFSALDVRDNRTYIPK